MSRFIVSSQTAAVSPLHTDCQQFPETKRQPNISFFDTQSCTQSYSDPNKYTGKPANLYVKSHGEFPFAMWNVAMQSTFPLLCA